MQPIEQAESNDEHEPPEAASHGSRLGTDETSCLRLAQCSGSARCLSLLRALQDNDDPRFVVCVSGHRRAGCYCVTLSPSFIELLRQFGFFLFCLKA